MVASFLLGICFKISSSVAGVVGKQLIGISARDNVLWRARAIFILGTLLTTILGAALEAPAYGYAAQSIVAPLGSLDIVLNMLLAPCLAKERVRPSHVIGTLLVAIGASLTAVFGPHKSKPPTVPQLQAKFFRWEVAAYAIFLTSLLCLCAYILQRRPKHVGDKLRGIALGVAAGSLAGNVCFVKCLVGLVALGFRGDWTPWTTWLPYGLVLVATCVAIGSVPLMLLALREYEAIFMVTLFSGCSIVTACVSGNLVLLEMADTEYFRKCCYWFSVALIIVGLLVINSTVRGISTATKPAGDNARLLRLHMEEPLPGEDIICELRANSSVACAAAPIEGQVDMHSAPRHAQELQRTSLVLQQRLHEALPNHESVDIQRISQLDKVPIEEDTEEYVSLSV